VLDNFYAYPAPQWWDLAFNDANAAMRREFGGESAIAEAIVKEYDCRMKKLSVAWKGARDTIVNFGRTHKSPLEKTLILLAAIAGIWISALTNAYRVLLINLTRNNPVGCLYFVQKPNVLDNS
jgi:hypothetical protein